MAEGKVVDDGWLCICYDVFSGSDPCLSLERISMVEREERRGDRENRAEK